LGLRAIDRSNDFLVGTASDLRLFSGNEDEVSRDDPLRLSCEEITLNERPYKDEAEHGFDSEEYDLFLLHEGLALLSVYKRIENSEHRQQVRDLCEELLLQQQMRS
jgi:hypothetical protein